MKIDYNNNLIAGKDNKIYILDLKNGKVSRIFEADSIIKIVLYQSDIFFLDKKGVSKYSEGIESNILEVDASNFDLLDENRFIFLHNDTIVKYDSFTNTQTPITYSGNYSLNGIFYIDPDHYILAGAIGVDGNICAPPVNLKSDRLGINPENAFFIRGNFQTEPFIVGEEILNENKFPIKDNYINDIVQTPILKYSTFNFKVNLSELELYLDLENNEISKLRIINYSQQNYLSFELPKNLKSGVYKLFIKSKFDPSIKSIGLNISVINLNFLKKKIDKTDPLLINAKKLLSHNTLFLSANPIGTPTLNLIKEKTEVEEALKSGPNNYIINFYAFDSVKPSTMVEEMIKLNPAILHFSGHGSETGIILMDDKLYPNYIDGKRMVDFFRNFKNLQLVILNACYSKKQALEIKKYVPYVVGMDAPISDNAAIMFSKLFYIALSTGYTIEESFLKAKAGVNFDKSDSGKMITLIKQ